MIRAELTDQQYEQVVHRLETSALSYQPLKEELIDHLCCAIENGIAEGLEFEAATEQAFAQFEEKEFEQIQRQTIYFLNHKKRIMKVITLTFLIVMAYFPAINLLSSSPPTTHPLGTATFTVSSGFGRMHHPITKAERMHKGIDFKAPAGTPVKAGGEGIVKTVNLHKGGYGIHVVIDHGDGFETLYAHLSEALVKEGQEVAPGQLIGKVGNTGASTGPHLHYEVRENGIPKDPIAFLAD